MALGAEFSSAGQMYLIPAMQYHLTRTIVYYLLLTIVNAGHCGSTTCQADELKHLASDSLSASLTGFLQINSRVGCECPTNSTSVCIGYNVEALLDAATALVVAGDKINEMEPGAAALKIIQLVADSQVSSGRIPAVIYCKLPQGSDQPLAGSFISWPPASSLKSGDAQSLSPLAAPPKLGRTCLVHLYAAYAAFAGCRLQNESPRCESGANWLKQAFSTLNNECFPAARRALRWTRDFRTVPAMNSYLGVDSSTIRSMPWTILARHPWEATLPATPGLGPGTVNATLLPAPQGRSLAAIARQLHNSPDPQCPHPFPVPPEPVASLQRPERAALSPLRRRMELCALGCGLQLIREGGWDDVPAALKCSEPRGWLRADAGLAAAWADETTALLLLGRFVGVSGAQGRRGSSRWKRGQLPAGPVWGGGDEVQELNDAAKGAWDALMQLLHAQSPDHDHEESGQRGGSDRRAGAPAPSPSLSPTPQLPDLLFYDGVARLHPAGLQGAGGTAGATTGGDAGGDGGSSQQASKYELTVALDLRVTSAGLMPLLVPPRGSTEPMQRRGEWAALADSWGWMVRDDVEGRSKEPLGLGLGPGPGLGLEQGQGQPRVDLLRGNRPLDASHGGAVRGNPRAETWRVRVADALLSGSFAPPPLVASLARNDPAFNASLGDSGPLWLRVQWAALRGANASHLGALQGQIARDTASALCAGSGSAGQGGDQIASNMTVQLMPAAFDSATDPQTGLELCPLPHSGSLHSAALTTILLAEPAAVVDPPPTPHDLRAVVVVLSVALLSALVVGLGVVVVGIVIVGSMSLERARTMSRLTGCSMDMQEGRVRMIREEDGKGAERKGRGGGGGQRAKPVVEQAWADDDRQRLDSMDREDPIEAGAGAGADADTGEGQSVRARKSSRGRLSLGRGSMEGMLARHHEGGEGVEKGASQQTAVDGASGRHVGQRSGSWGTEHASASGRATAGSGSAGRGSTGSRHSVSSSVQYSQLQEPLLPVGESEVEWGGAGEGSTEFTDPRRAPIERSGSQALYEVVRGALFGGE